MILSIEHGILRANRKPPASLRSQFSSNDRRAKYALKNCDARIHFALVCGAKSCPAVSCYDAENIESTLDMATTAFLESPCNLSVDVEKREITLSMLFKWYRHDFAKSDYGIVMFILAYVQDRSIKEKLEEVIGPGKKFKIVYSVYDWDSNQRTKHNKKKVQRREEEQRA